MARFFNASVKNNGCRSVIQKRASWLGLVALAYFAWLMLRITWQYVPPSDDVAFLRIKQSYLTIFHWKLAFWIHVYTSMLTLAAGFTQFAPTLLAKRPVIHRRVGKIYVVVVCLVSGPSGFVMGLYANGGLTSRIAFVLLAVLWIGATGLAWRAVLMRRWQKHREWMIRSYALTLSAITLRIWKYLIVMTFAPRPMDVYRIVAWLGFIPNLLIAEWWIRRSRKAVELRLLCDKR